MSMDKILSSTYTIIIISCLLTGMITFWITTKYIDKRTDIFYVVDIKKIVDSIKKEYILQEYVNPYGKNEKFLSEKFKKLSGLLKSYPEPIFEKGAIVNEISTNVVDLTPYFMKELGLKEVEVKKDGKKD